MTEGTSAGAQTTSDDDSSASTHQPTDGCSAQCMGTNTPAAPPTRRTMVSRRRLGGGHRADQQSS